MPEPEPQVNGSNTRVFHAVTPGGSTYIGVGLQEIDTERARALKLRDEAGVEISKVEDDSPASRAGLKVGDAILQFNGQRVEGFEQFARFVRETPAGRDVRLTISRDGNVQTLVVKVAARKGIAMTMPNMPHIEIPTMPDMPRVFTMWRSSMFGVEAEALSGQLADYFGVKEGVLVRSVIKDSAAAKAGLKAGDVILKVNDAKVTNPNEVSAAVRTSRGKTVPVSILRDHREMNVNATFEAEHQDGDSVTPRARAGGRSIKM